MASEVIQEAAAIFAASELEREFEALWRGGERQRRVDGGVGQFFLATRVSAAGEAGQWRSDLAWISVDDPPTYKRFAGLFERSGVASCFASIVEHDHSLRLYTAFYVVRTRCAGLHLHTDFGRAVGTSALVLMTPLADYDQSTEDFHLMYEAGDPDDPAAIELAQYRYKLHRALVFASRFRHSTQPGRASGDRPHVFLCFVFGTDRPFHWPAIVQALEYLQSRMIMRPDGGMVHAGDQ